MFHFYIALWLLDLYFNEEKINKLSFIDISISLKQCIASVGHVNYITQLSGKNW